MYFQTYSHTLKYFLEEGGGGYVTHPGALEKFLAVLRSSGEKERQVCKDRERREDPVPMHTWLLAIQKHKEASVFTPQPRRGSKEAKVHLDGAEAASCTEKHTTLLPLERQVFYNIKFS